MFVRAKQTKPKEVTYWDEEGGAFIYSDGNRPWRYQNPGNLGYGEFTLKHGAIGRAGDIGKLQFAVFPDYEIGRSAHEALLEIPKYQKKTLERVITVFSPSTENDTKRYIQLVHLWTGYDMSRKLNTLTDEEFQTFVNAMERMEGKFKVGTIRKVPIKKQITRVRKDKKGVITDFFVPEFGWLSKPEAIRRAKKNEIDAVVATSRDGNLYLRARPGAADLDSLPSD